ncbi:MAG: tRNA 2-thiouridine(34) synthase MnmA [Lachnospiraceae bacterium]|nr:tRNA 2-thiouridine(34) synthase MnmA [Lachnospiraceae bacterium]
MANSKGKVLVGMSGGVDSSVAALLLQRMGYEVIGVTLQLWREDKVSGELSESGVAGERNIDFSAAEDAKRVAEKLGIPHYVLDFGEIFRTCVVDRFLSEYLHGRTPNPCVVCNRYVKWEALLKKAGELGADYIATGHYARIIKLRNGRFSLGMSKGAIKDQTYALYDLTQEQLSRTLMPLGQYDKDEVRAIAAEANLPVANKPDSQEICFIPDHDYGAFIEREVMRCAGCRACPPAGNFVTKDGTILGRHKGIIHYTIGQRRGLGLPMGRHVYVTEIRPDTNEVVVGEGEDVFSRGLICSGLNFMSVEDLEPGSSRRLFAKIRYRHKGEWCRATRCGKDCIRVEFEKPVRAVTPGQALVFYEARSEGDSVRGEGESKTGGAVQGEGGAGHSPETGSAQGNGGPGEDEVAGLYEAGRGAGHNPGKDSLEREQGLSDNTDYGFAGNVGDSCRNGDERELAIDEFQVFGGGVIDSAI